MGIQITEKCTRCRREETAELKDLKEAAALNDLQERRASTEAKIREFLATLPADELPDFVGVKGGKVVVHQHLCSKGGPKSNCDKRVDALLEDIDVLEERKPRSKKSSSTETPPAAV